MGNDAKMAGRVGVSEFGSYNNIGLWSFEPWIATWQTPSKKILTNHPDNDFRGEFTYSPLPSEALFKTNCICPHTKLALLECSVLAVLFHLITLQAGIVEARCSWILGNYNPSGKLKTTEDDVFWHCMHLICAINARFRRFETKNNESRFWVQSRNCSHPYLIGWSIEGRCILFFFYLFFFLQ